MAVELQEEGALEKYMNKALELSLINDPFLFYDNTFRISPPLTITAKEVDEVIVLIKEALAG